MLSVAQPLVSPQTVPDPWPTITFMRAARRWMIWRAIPEPGKSKPRKVPFYVSGAPRNGALDTPEDVAQLASYEAAKAALAERGSEWGLGFALGPDGSGWHWQGIDLDDVRENGLSDLANIAPGYVEMSPSGEGAHALGYGRHFVTLGANATGVEAYAGGRFFTVTEWPIRDGGLTCLAGYVEQALAPRHAAGRSPVASAIEVTRIDAKTVTELRSALASMRSDDRDLWVRMGHALRELGDVGRALWFDWSQTSEKYAPKDAARVWNSLRPTGTGYQAVFAVAQRGGWVNPGSNAAQLESAPANQPSITLDFAMSGDLQTVKLEYLCDPYLPRRCVVGFFGRGSTAKSSFLASIAAAMSTTCSTLWVSAEEPREWIKTRHVAAGGQTGTLAVPKVAATKKDAQGRVTGSTFNVYEHLEPAIVEMKARCDLQRPLRLVVLDTAVGLTGWAKGEGPNDDASVKRLLAFLQHLAEEHDLTIAFIGHSNKGRHEHFADTVAGGSAWTNSPRLSFVHAKDRREEHGYVMRVAKSNVGQPFGGTYTTTPVHTLYERPDGSNDVLCRVEPGPIVRGEEESMELFEAATRRPDEEGEDGGRGGRGPSLVESVIQCIVQLVHATGQDITRDMVQAQLGREVHRRDWIKIDDRLALTAFQWRVALAKGPQNKAIYRKMT